MHLDLLEIYTISCPRYIASFVNATAMATPFVHTPLESPSRIRLVRFSTGRHDGMLSCEISQHDLNDEENLRTRPYRALSYTWGTDTACHDILINGRSSSISQTLHDFFSTFTDRTRREQEVAQSEVICESEPKSLEEGGISALLRKRDILPKVLKERRQAGWTDYMWVDQLCINQKDVREKGHQVAMMKHVYTKTANVIVWLDPRFGPDRGHLVGHPYWMRLWVVQELLLSPTRTIFYGNKELKGNDPISGGDEWVLATTDAMNLWMDFSRVFTHRTLLGHYITKYGAHACKDPRDKVYGLLALVETSIEVDYSKSVEQVFWDATFELLQWLREQFVSRKSRNRRDRQCVQGIQPIFRLAYNMMPERWQAVKDSECWEENHAAKFFQRYCMILPWPASETVYQVAERQWTEALKKFCFAGVACVASTQSECKCFDQSW